MSQAWVVEKSEGPESLRSLFSSVVVQLGRKDSYQGFASQAAEKLRFGADFGKGTTSVVPLGPLKSIALQRLRVALCRKCKKLTSGAKART